MPGIKVTTIIPKPLNVAQARNALKVEARKVTDGFESDFARTYRTFSNKPGYIAFTDTSQPGRIVSAWESADENYVRLSEGTRPHVIRPRRAPILYFPSAFVSKTLPGVIDASAGFVGERNTVTRVVNHPGFAGRNFPGMIKPKWARLYPRRMQAALNRFAKTSGHSV